MTSNNIYTPILPTYLYIKQHSVTGLKYFGKTTQDPYKYKGSGRYWTSHIKKHGRKLVNTIWVSELYNDTSISKFALSFSELFDIVESIEWANLKPEDGLDGGSHKGINLGKIHSIDHRKKNGDARRGIPQTEESNRKRSESSLGVSKTESHKENMKTPKSQSHKENISKSVMGLTTVFDFIELKCVKIHRDIYQKLKGIRYVALNSFVYKEFKKSL
jgi:hypothetical protein